MNNVCLEYSIMHKVSFSYWIEMCIFFNMYDTLGEILYRTINHTGNFKHAEMPNVKKIEKKLYVSTLFLPVPL